MRLTMMAVVCMVFAGRFLPAQHMQMLDGPEGATTFQLKTDRSGVLYFVTPDGDLFRSADLAVHWTFLGRKFPLQSVACLGIDTSGALWMGTFDTVGFYRSTNLGTSWEPARAGLPSGTYASSFFVHPSGRLFTATTKGVFEWSEGGQIWLSRNSGLTTPPTITVLSSRSDSVLYCGTSKGGIYRSTDLGASWMRDGFLPVQNSILTLVGEYQGVMIATTIVDVYQRPTSDTVWTKYTTQFPVGIGPAAYVSGDGTTLYIANAKGVFRASAGVASWSALGTAGLRVSWIKAITTHNAATIIAAAIDGGIFRTSNQGVSWTMANAGIARADVRSMVITPQGEILTGMWGGISGSTNGGGSWLDRSVSLPNYLVNGVFSSPKGTLFAGTSGGLYRSTNNGTAWALSSGDLGIAGPDRMLAISNGTLIASAQGWGIYRSTDDGLTWTQKNTGLTSVSVQTIVRDQRDNLYAAMGGGLMFRSTNAGDSWTPIANLGVNAFCLRADTNGVVIAGTYFSGIYRSTDTGATFTKIQNVLGSESVYAFETNAGGHLFAGSSAGLYRSRDAGLTWSLFDTLVFTFSPTVLRFDADHVLYCATNGSGLWKDAAPSLQFFSATTANAGSVKTGDSLALDCSVFNPAIFAMTIAGTVFSNGTQFAIRSAPAVIAPMDSAVVHLVFKPTIVAPIIDTLKVQTNLGLLRLVVTGTGLSPTEVDEARGDLLPRAHALSQNYPNPFNPTTAIRFAIPSTEHINLVVFNLLGEEVAVLFNGTVAPGNYAAEWNAERHPNGVYFYRLTAGKFVETKKLVLLK